MFVRLSLVLAGCCCLAGLCRGGDDSLVLASMHGTVHDPDGKPIAGAVVRINGTEGYAAKRGGSAGSGRGKTDAEGKYTLAIYTKPDGKVRVTSVQVEAKRFVRTDEDCLWDGLLLLPGKSAELNFVLARGEVLAGAFQLPLRSRERRDGVKPQDRKFFFSVRGPSFKKYFVTEGGGAFEIWVPHGRYSIELLEPARQVRKENVPSGSRDVKLVFVDPVIPEETLARAFDAVWEDMDRHYSHFIVKKVDWKALKKRYRAKAVKGRTLRNFVEVLEEMLAALRDGHVWLQWPEGAIYPYGSGRPGNYNRQAILATLEDVNRCGEFALVGKTKGDGFAALILTRQSQANATNVDQVIEFIHSMRDAPGFLVDLREANGGDERLAQQIARQFCGTDTVYAKSKYRNGPGHEDFGPIYDRVLKAVDQPYSKSVVCLIGPRAVSSGEGFVQMMKCLPNVTTIGLPTRGSSGNPKPFKLPGVEVTVFYSRWVDLMPDGTAIEGAGIAPEVELNFPAKDYANKDPTWDKALEMLRKKAADRH